MRRYRFDLVLAGVALSTSYGIVTGDVNGGSAIVLAIAATLVLVSWLLEGAL